MGSPAPTPGTTNPDLGPAADKAPPSDNSGQGVASKPQGEQADDADGKAADGTPAQ